MAAELKVTKFDIDGRKICQGTDNPTPVFHFAVDTASPGKQISAYRIKVTMEGRRVWDSGKCPYKNDNYVVYEGEPLEPKSVCEATLQLWDERDEKQEAVRQTFETGFLGTGWEAGWIEPAQENAEEEKQLSFTQLLIPNPEFWGGEARLKPVRQLRRSVFLEKKVKRARIYASAHGIYNLCLNARRLSVRRLAPENSAYGKALYYQTYDVTGELVQGENVIGVCLADGWWIGRLGLSGDSCNYGNRLGFIMQLEIAYTDGSREVICSDERFRSSESFIRYSDLYIGEKQDLSVRDDSWMRAGYDDSAWDVCSRADYDRSCLTAQPLDPVCVTDIRDAVRIFETPKKELVLDFGQVTAGVLHITLRAKEGDIITFEHGEILDRDGNYINNILGRNKDQKDVLVCAEGEQVFEPQFTYHGFRYVRVSGLKKSQIVAAKAYVMGSPVEPAGQFRCSDERLNRLQRNICRSTAANMFSVPTDCPQREKLGWTGDIQVFAKTGCFNYDLRNFLSAWLMNMRAEQTADGEIPVVVPNPPKQEQTQRLMSGGSNSSAAWGDACVLVPWYLYECYGDRRVLLDNLSMMERWLDYIRESCTLKPEGYGNFTEEQKARNPYLWTKQYHFGDWLIPSLRALPDGVKRGTAETAQVVGSAFYAVTVSHYIRVLRALGMNEKADLQEALLEKIRRAVREEFVAADGTVNGSSLQGLYVIVLKAGIVEGELRQKVARRLVTLIHENGDCLDTGFVSVPYLLDVLTDNGYRELAYRLLFQTKPPSWLYMVEMGATTVWENWLAIAPDGTPTESSYNHYAFGCVGDWIYRHIGGIRRLEPGYRRILFAPDAGCGLTESSCSVNTPYGAAALSWRLEEGGTVLAAGRVPVGTTAELRIGEEVRELVGGAFSVRVKLKTE